MKKLKEMKKNNKGFSLVELIIVIAIMAVLMAVLAPQFLRYVERSRYQKDMSAVGELENAMKVAASNETVVASITTWPVAAEIDGDTGDVTWTNASDEFLDEVNATIMGNPSHAITTTLGFTSTTISTATADITVSIADTGVTTMTNVPAAP